MVDVPYIQFFASSKSKWMERLPTFVDAHVGYIRVNSSHTFLLRTGDVFIFVFGECIGRSCSLPPHGKIDAAKSDKK